MNNLENNISDISINYYKYLLNLENVTGIGLGFKKINNINTFEPCIHVLVEKKINSKYISSNNLVPKSYMGIKTDVIQSKKFIINSSTSNTQIFDDISRPLKIRPLMGGCRLLAGNIVGTLGCIVYKKKLLKKQYFILSTNSVLANINSHPIGFPIIQTSSLLAYQNFKKDIVANLSTFIPLKTPFTSIITRENYVDCALAKIIKKSYVYDFILGINAIKGSTFGILGETVKKSGYSTGVTTGKIITKSATIMARVKDYNLTFKSQLVADVYSKVGDSGSIVLNGKDEAVGLLFASSEESNNDNDKNFSVFCDINVITSLLNIEIYTKK